MKFKSVERRINITITETELREVYWVIKRIVKDYEANTCQDIEIDDIQKLNSLATQFDVILDAIKY